MANKILLGRAIKESDGGSVMNWRFVYEFAKAANSPIDEQMDVDPDEVNTIWYVKKHSIVIESGNAAAVGDITVKDSGSPVTVSEINPETGKVTLSATPSTTPTATYKYAEKATHKEIIVMAEEMTDTSDANEAKTKANVKAQTARTDWLAKLAAATTLENQPSLEGSVSL